VGSGVTQRAGPLPAGVDEFLSGRGAGVALHGVPSPAQMPVGPAVRGPSRGGGLLVR
jgi:hypothetical protein